MLVLAKSCRKVHGALLWFDLFTLSPFDHTSKLPTHAPTGKLRDTGPELAHQVHRVLSTLRERAVQGYGRG